jgi:hypothetical protein
LTINENDRLKKSATLLNLENDGIEELEDQQERKSQEPEFEIFGTALNEL